MEAWYPLAVLLPPPATTALPLDARLLQPLKTPLRYPLAVLLTPKAIARAVVIFEYPIVTPFNELFWHPKAHPKELTVLSLPTATEHPVTLLPEPKA
jgi:hypothetical protein